MSTHYEHPEAFCLMQYQDQVTKEIEVLWNSRDGVTPVIISSRRGNEAMHVNFLQDLRVPEFKPTPGMRIFVDASAHHKHIRDAAREYVDKYWKKDIGGGQTMENTLGKTKDEAIDHFVSEWTKPGTPTVVEVT